MKRLYQLLGILFFLIISLSACKNSYVVKECTNITLDKRLRPLSVGESITVEICSADPRNHTGILLKVDEVYSFEVVPSTNRWKDSWLKPFTAEGRSLPLFTVLHLFKRKVFANWFSLIGSIENKRKTYFKIGCAYLNYSPKQSGQLICFANDVRGDYWYLKNNEGALMLKVTRIK